MNFLSIASTLAARFLSENVTPPSGMQNIRGATALVGSSIVPPSVVVFPPETLPKWGAQVRTSVLSFPVRFYYTTIPTDKRDMTDLYRWAAVLYDQLIGNVQLAGAPVAQAVVSALRFVETEYDGQAYDGIELDVDVTTSEGVSPTA